MSTPRRRPHPNENDDFEIVDEAPTPAKRKPPRAAAGDDEDEPAVAPRRKRRPAAVEDDDEPLPARVVAEPDDDTEQEEPVRGPRRKKKRRDVDQPAEEPGANEWVIPLVLMGLGLVLTVVGTAGIARGDPDFGLSAGAAVAFRLIGQVIAIPVTIAALIGIGVVMGIEYGTLTGTVRNLAAMGLLMGGLLDVFDWMRLPWFVCQPIMLVIGLGLLMSLFGLDVDEAMATMVGLNVLSFLLKVAVFMVVMMMVHKAVNKGPDRGVPPGWVDPGDDDPDADGPDAVPQPKAKGKGKKGVDPRPKGRPPVVVDPDDD